MCPQADAKQEAGWWQLQQISAHLRCAPRLSKSHSLPCMLPAALHVITPSALHHQAEKLHQQGENAQLHATQSCTRMRLTPEMTMDVFRPRLDVTQAAGKLDNRPARKRQEVKVCRCWSSNLRLAAWHDIAHATDGATRPSTGMLQCQSKSISFRRPCVHSLAVGATHTTVHAVVICYLPGQDVCQGQAEQHGQHPCC